MSEITFSQAMQEYLLAFGASRDAIGFRLGYLDPELPEYIDIKYTYEINKAKHLVPDELVHKITASGKPGETHAKVNEYTNRGCTCPILDLVGGNFKLLIDTFA